MKDDEAKRGFEYFLDRERIREYMRKPVHLRLAWLYQGNVLRMHLPRNIKERQDRLRHGS